MNEGSITEEHTTSQHHTQPLKPKGDPKPRKQEVYYFEYSLSSQVFARCLKPASTWGRELCQIGTDTVKPR